MALPRVSHRVNYESARGDLLKLVGQGLLTRRMVGKAHVNVNCDGARRVSVSVGPRRHAQPRLPLQHLHVLSQYSSARSCVRLTQNRSEFAKLPQRANEVGHHPLLRSGIKVQSVVHRNVNQMREGEAHKGRVLQVVGGVIATGESVVGTIDS